MLFTGNNIPFKRNESSGVLIHKQFLKFNFRNLYTLESCKFLYILIRSLISNSRTRTNANLVFSFFYVYTTRFFFKTSINAKTLRIKIKFNINWLPLPVNFFFEKFGHYDFKLLRFHCRLLIKMPVARALKIQSRQINHNLSSYNLITLESNPLRN